MFKTFSSLVALIFNEDTSLTVSVSHFESLIKCMFVKCVLSFVENNNEISVF